MTTFTDSLIEVAEDAGEAGIVEILKTLGDLEPKTALQRAALTALVAAIEEHGTTAVHAAIGDLQGLLQGDPLDAEAIYALSPRARSEILAQLQLAESDRGSTLKYVDLVGDVLGRLIATAGKVALASAI